jgi:hypothetical protein
MKKADMFDISPEYIEEFRQEVHAAYNKDYPGIGFVQATQIREDNEQMLYNKYFALSREKKK